MSICINHTDWCGGSADGQSGTDFCSKTCEELTKEQQENMPKKQKSILTANEAINMIYHLVSDNNEEMIQDTPGEVLIEIQNILDEVKDSIRKRLKV